MKGVCIGAGNVASALSVALCKDVDFVQVYSRNIDNASSLGATLGSDVKATDCLASICRDADFYLVSIKDDALGELAMRVGFRNDAVWAHTSGSVPASVLSPLSDNYGVFYPLQTFSKGRSIAIDKIPFFIEGSNRPTKQMLTGLAHRLSDNVYDADSSTRAVLHIAGVISCNFTTELLSITRDILNTDNIPLDVVEPLVKETISKCFSAGPVEAMTGPARRGDLGVIRRQLQRLEGNEREIYRLLTESILNRYGNEPHKL